MAIRLKMSCVESVLRRVGKGWYVKDGSGRMAEARFQVVTGGSPENDAFFVSTPGGSLEFKAANAGVLDGLEPGVEYYVTVERA